MRIPLHLGLLGLITLTATPALAQGTDYIQYANPDSLLSAFESARSNAQLAADAPASEASALEARAALTIAPEETSLPPGAWQRKKVSGVVSVTRIVCVRAPCNNIVMVGDTQVIGKWAGDIEGFEGQVISIDGVQVPRIIGPPEPPIFIPRPTPGLPSEPIKLDEMPTDPAGLTIAPFQPNVLAVDHFVPGEVAGDFITGSVLRTKTIVSATSPTPYGPLNASIPTPATVIQTTEGNFIITDPSVAERLDALEGADVTISGFKGADPEPLPWWRRPTGPREFDAKRNGFLVKGAVTSDPSRAIIAQLRDVLGDSFPETPTVGGFNDYNLVTANGDPLYLHSVGKLPASEGEYRWATVNYEKNRGGQALLTGLSGQVPSQDFIVIPFDPIPLHDIGTQDHRSKTPVFEAPEDAETEVQVGLDRSG